MLSAAGGRPILSEGANMSAGNVVVWCAAMGLAAALLGGCGEGGATLDSKIGSPCTVQFRRGDALGAGAPSPVPPTTNVMNGADVCLSGTLTRVTHDWILVTYKGNDVVKEYHIPKEAILLVEFLKPVEPPPSPRQAPADVKTK
jgi:hypothetical protein